MLVLARQLNERIVMPTVPATIEVVAIKPNAIRLGIDAPPQITILREEILRRGGFVAASPPSECDAEKRLAQVRHILRNRLHSVVLGLELLGEQSKSTPSPERDAMLRRMEDDVRTLDRQLRTILDDPLEEASVSVHVEAVSAHCLGGANGDFVV